MNMKKVWDEWGPLDMSSHRQNHTPVQWKQLEEVPVVMQKEILQALAYA